VQSKSREKLVTGGLIWRRGTRGDVSAECRHTGAEVVVVQRADMWLVASFLAEMADLNEAEGIG
jgi:hypothetical protein